MLILTVNPFMDGEQVDSHILFPVGNLELQHIVKLIVSVHCKFQEDVRGMGK